MRAEGWPRRTWLRKKMNGKAGRWRIRSQGAKAEGRGVCSARMESKWRPASRERCHLQRVSKAPSGCWRENRHGGQEWRQDTPQYHLLWEVAPKAHRWALGPPQVLYLLWVPPMAQVWELTLPK